MEPGTYGDIWWGSGVGGLGPGTNPSIVKESGRWSPGLRLPRHQRGFELLRPPWTPVVPTPVRTRGTRPVEIITVPRERRLLTGLEPLLEGLSRKSWGPLESLSATYVFRNDSRTFGTEP